VTFLILIIVVSLTLTIYLGVKQVVQLEELHSAADRIRIAVDILLEAEEKKEAETNP